MFFQEISPNMLFFTNAGSSPLGVFAMFTTFRCSYLFETSEGNIHLSILECRKVACLDSVLRLDFPNPGILTNSCQVVFKFLSSRKFTEVSVDC